MSIAGTNVEYYNFTRNSNTSISVRNGLQATLSAKLNGVPVYSSSPPFGIPAQGRIEGEMGGWNLEPYRIKVKITHSISARAKTAEIIIANPRNIAEQHYTAFTPVRLKEASTGAICFSGVVISSVPSYDSSLGQILTVTCRDKSNSLLISNVGTNPDVAHGGISADYSGVARKRYKVSAVDNQKGLINKLIEDFTYPGAISQSNANESGSSDLIARDLTGNGKSVMALIEEMASEDYWTNSVFQSAWLYNGTYNSFATTSRDLWANVSDIVYLGQNNPFLGAVFTLVTLGDYGDQTWQYWNGSTWADLVLNETFDFKSATGKIQWNLPSDWATTTINSITGYFVKGAVSSVSNVAKVNNATLTVRGCGYDYYVNESGEFQYFRRSSYPVGGAKNNGLTITNAGITSDTSRIMQPDYSFTDDAIEIVTRVTVHGNDETGAEYYKTLVNTELETRLQMRKELVEYVWGKDMTAGALQQYCDNRAAALLQYHDEGLTRGKVKIAGYPIYTIGGVPHLVQAGDMVHIVCTTKQIDEDFLVLDFTYEEPTGTTTFNLVSNIWGRGFSPYETNSVLAGLRSGADITLTSARINDLVVDDAKINSLTVNKVTTGIIGGTYSTASSTARVDLSTSGLLGYNSSGVNTFALNTNGSGQVGQSGVAWDTSGNTTFKGQVAVGGSIRSTNYSAGSSGWTIDASGTAEFNNVTVRGKVYATDGEFAGTLKTASIDSGSTLTVNGTISAGSGLVTISSTGISVNAPTQSGGLRLYANSNLAGWLESSYNSGSGVYDVKLAGYSGVHANLTITAGGYLYLDSGTGYDIETYKSFYPYQNNAYNLGGSSNQWKNIYGVSIFASSRLNIPIASGGTGAGDIWVSSSTSGRLYFVDKNGTACYIDKTG